MVIVTVTSKHWDEVLQKLRIVNWDSTSNLLLPKQHESGDIFRNWLDDDPTSCAVSHQRLDLIVWDGARTGKVEVSHTQSISSGGILFKPKLANL